MNDEIVSKRFSLVDEIRNGKFYSSELREMISKVSGNIKLFNVDEYILLEQNKADYFSKPFESFNEKKYRTGVIRFHPSDKRIIVPANEFMPLYIKNKFKELIHWKYQLDHADFIVKIKKAVRTPIEQILEEELNMCGYKSKEEMLNEVSSNNFLVMKREANYQNMVTVYAFSEILTNLGLQEKKELLGIKNV